MSVGPKPGHILRKRPFFHLIQKLAVFAYALIAILIQQGNFIAILIQHIY